MALSVHIKKKLKDFELAVDFDMDEGIVGFLGSSGCGKSMTLKSVSYTHLRRCQVWNDKATDF